MSEITSDDTGETNDMLIEAAAEAGFVVSKRQLAEWHRAGLLPTPRRVPRVGTSPGMRSVYPPGTADQLLALCRCRERYPHRRDELAWSLWWAGYAVPMRYVRPVLEGARSSWQQGLDELRRLAATPADDPDAVSEALLDLLDRTATARLATKTLRQARKRLGRDRFPTLVRVILQVASGTFEGYSVDAVTGTDEAERRLVEAGLGLERARTDRFADTVPWLTGDTGHLLAMLSRGLRGSPIGADLETTSDEAIRWARDEASSILEMIEGFSTLVERMYQRGAFGFGGLAQAIRDATPRDQALMLLFWRMLRAWGLGEHMDAFVAAAQQWRTLWYPVLQAVESLRKEMPETGELLGPKRMGVALRKPSAMDELLAALRALYEQHGDEIRAFVARHPEIPTPPAEPDDTETNEETTSE
jgi:hypothetical protein